MLYLSQGLVPLEKSGKEVTSLDYELKKASSGEEDQHEADCLQCSDVARLADALAGNSKFCGPLNLEDQPLTDISGLHLGRILSQGKNITKLNLSQKPEHCKFTHKTGQYIGQAILDNPECGLHKLDFEGISLGAAGLQRVIEAANLCGSIEKLIVGVVDDAGLRILAEMLATNASLEELEFSETSDHQKYWTGEACAAFVSLLKNCTKLKKVKAKFQKCNKESRAAQEFHE